MVVGIANVNTKTKVNLHVSILQHRQVLKFHFVKGKKLIQELQIYYQSKAT